MNHSSSYLKIVAYRAPRFSLFAEDSPHFALSHPRFRPANQRFGRGGRAFHRAAMADDIRVQKTIRQKFTRIFSQTGL
jgi:hypothetical protein